LESIFLISFICPKTFPEIRIKRLRVKRFFSSSLFIEWAKVKIVSIGLNLIQNPIVNRSFQDLTISISLSAGKVGKLLVFG
jgi:hypothetical protein